jgi:GAF domain-containing protein
MTEQELTARHLTESPAADGAAERAARHRELGLAAVPDERFDAFARKIVESTGALAAMVNLVGDQRMYFAGIATKPDLEPGDPTFLGDPGREMDLDRGFCPHVVARRKALVLDDVYAYPRFAGNPVVDELGVRSYLGAPLIDDDGTVIGTVCAVDPSPHSGAEHAGWGNRGLETIKRVADEVVADIRARRRVSELIEATLGSVMVTEGENLHILNVNTAHERLFGAVRQLGVPAAEAFPGLGIVGVPAAVRQVRGSGVSAVTAPVRLTDGRGLLFAVVPSQVPGHSRIELTVGLIDATAESALAAARELSDHLAELCE